MMKVLNIHDDKFARKLEDKLYFLMKNGSVDNNLLHMLLCRNVKNVERFEEFLDSADFMLRYTAVKIIGKFKNDISVLLTMLENEEEVIIVDEIINVIVDRNLEVDMLVEIYEKFPLLIDKIIKLMIAKNKEEYLTLLLFDKDENLVNYLKSKLEDKKIESK